MITHASTTNINGCKIKTNINVLSISGNEKNDQIFISISYKFSEQTIFWLQKSFPAFCQSLSSFPSTKIYTWFFYSLLKSLSKLHQVCKVFEQQVWPDSFTCDQITLKFDPDFLWCRTKSGQDTPNNQFPFNLCVLRKDFLKKIQNLLIF